MIQNKQPSPSDSFIFNRTGHSSRNRTVLAAMTNKQSHSDGTLSQAEIKWLTRRARGGFGIITTAAAHVSKDGQGWDGELGLFDDMHIDKLTTLTDSIHNHGSLSLAQLFHGGMRSPQYLTTKPPISASKIPSNESKSGFTRPASEKDIKRLINNFTEAAVRCVQAGFDGIELHGAHGYLISQFLGTKTNMRKDEWGGDLKNRSRFLIEIYSSIKENVPDSFIVGVRISPEISDMGINLDDSISLAGFLRDEGIDYLHISCWDVFAKSKEYPDDPRRLTEWFTQNLDDLPPIISTGSVWSRLDAQDLMNQGADLIGVARVGIPYPSWPKKLFQKNYNPPRAPFTVKHLREAGLSDVFINYMQKWDGFVSKNNE
jgi:2,4-dienoyl-CoA reductase-like NADH-dependent reductase (Old Yellow Enzyme family)